MTSMAERLRLARHMTGLTQDELGERCGIRVSVIRMYEAGRLNPKYGTVKRICNVLGVHPLEIVDPALHSRYLSDARDVYRQVREGLTRIQAVSEGDAEEEAAFLARELDKMIADMSLRLVSDADSLSNAKARREERQKAVNQAWIAEVFSRLNPAGQRAAVTRIEELAELPKYKKCEDG